MLVTSKLIFVYLAVICVNQVNLSPTPKFSFKKTPRENYESRVAELDKHEILERSNFSSEEDDEEQESKTRPEGGGDSDLPKTGEYPFSPYIPCFPHGCPVYPPMGYPVWYGPYYCLPCLGFAPHGHLDPSKFVITGFGGGEEALGVPCMEKGDQKLLGQENCSKQTEEPATAPDLIIHEVEQSPPCQNSSKCTDCLELSDKVKFIKVDLKNLGNFDPAHKGAAVLDVDDLYKVQSCPVCSENMNSRLTSSCLKPVHLCNSGNFTCPTCTRYRKELNDY